MERKNLEDLKGTTLYRRLEDKIMKNDGPKLDLNNVLNSLKEDTEIVRSSKKGLSRLRESV